MSKPVLLLNADAQPVSLCPLSTISWQLAIKAYFLDKVRIIESYDDLIRSANFSMQKPSIVMLKRYHKLPSSAKFTRRNMFIRDKFTCQYCHDVFPQDELTIDHVLPRRLGGASTWENCTTACKSCNWKKGGELYRPKNKPIKPTYHELNHKFKNIPLHIQDDSWKTYISWPDELIFLNKQAA